MAKEHYQIELSRGTVILARVEVDASNIWEAHNGACALKSQLEAVTPRAKFAKHQEGVLISTKRLPDA